MKHNNLIKLIEKYPSSKIIIMSGIIKHVNQFITEMKQLKKDINIDYIISRNKDAILDKIKEINHDIF